MKFLRRKAKAMATQTEDKAVDQMAPVVVSLPDPDIEKEHPEECDELCGGQDTTADLLHTDLNALHDDGGETGTVGDPTAPNYEADVPAELKAEGKYAFGIVAPEGRDDIKYETYDPREFILVHHEVWTDVTATADEATGLAQGALQLARELRAQKRGMRKVNKHWSETKRTLRRTENLRREDNKWWANHDLAQCQRHAEEIKKKDIFATRLARRLRKARAGRDKRERQLQQADNLLDQANAQIANMERYIKHLEFLAFGNGDQS